MHVVLSLRDDFLMRCREQAALAPVRGLTPLAGAAATDCGGRWSSRRGSAATASRTRRWWRRWWRRSRGRGRAAAARLRGGAAVGAARPREEAAHPRGLRGGRRRGGRPGAARRGDARPHRHRAPGHRARDVPQPGDRPGHAGGDRPRGAAVGVPGARGGGGGAAAADRRAPPHVATRWRAGRASRAATGWRSCTSRCSRPGRASCAGRRRTRRARSCATSCRQAARLWDDKGRTTDLLWTGTACQEFELWRSVTRAR